MGLFDNIKNILFGKNMVSQDLFPEEKALLSQISRINLTNQEITPELYQQFREFEVAWLERHYDCNSIDGINCIPVTKDLPRAPSPLGSMRGHTGEVYYYLRHKAYQHEDSGNIELALACMRKSVALVKCRDVYSSDDCAPLAKMLARCGFVKEAQQERLTINQTFGSNVLPDNVIKAEIRRGNELRDFHWLQSAIPEKCPKSISSYRRMKTQNTKNYQALKLLAAEKGRNI